MVEVQGLGHQFPDGVWGLEDIHFRLESSDWTIVAGENGSGKTLLMRHLVGLAVPTRGKVLYQGKPVHEQLGRVRQDIGLVFQDSGAQIVGLTLREEVAFGPRNLGWSSADVRAAVAEALATVGLEGREDTPCAQLSGGELRRLAIAGVLAMKPRYLVLDEPFTGLDLASVRAVLKTLERLHQNGTGILLLTHELDKCLAHATGLVLMGRARILAQGTPAALWDHILPAGVHRPQGPVDLLAGMTWLDA